VVRPLCRKSITVLVGTKCRSSSRGSSARGGRHCCVEGVGPAHPLCPARLDGDPILCDLHDCLDRHSACGGRRMPVVRERLRSWTVGGQSPSGRLIPYVRSRQVSCARQAEAEYRSPIPCALGHEVTMLGPRELSGDGKPETRTGAFVAGAGCLRPVEAVEDTG
jgi:hypothetical protein